MFKSWLIQAEVSALLENQSKTHALEVLGRTKSNSTEAGKTRVHLRLGSSVLILKFLVHFLSQITDFGVIHLRFESSQVNSAENLCREGKVLRVS